MIYAWLTALVLAMTGSFLAGVEWQQGRAAIALTAALAERDRAQASVNEVALTHATNTAIFNRKLGAARVQLRDLSTGRNCLSPAAVGVLNAIGPTVPDAPAGASSAPTAAATDRDVGDALAVCRGAYSQLTEQVNAILDIEDMRHRPGGGVAAPRAARPVTQPPPAVQPE